MAAAGFEADFVNICNDINKNPKVFQKNADNISVSKNKYITPENIIRKGFRICVSKTKWYQDLTDRRI